MARLKVRNFGPIQEGLEERDGYIDFRPVTLFIGNQGSGKSTLAKLYSTMSWIEKGMTKGILKQNDLSVYNRFVKILEYQRLNRYVREQTEIIYKGESFNFSFIKGVFSVEEKQGGNYVLPKVMYVPAERNFLSSTDRPDRLKNLPAPLYTFLDEFDGARNLFSTGIVLPINNIAFRYDRANKLSHISDPNSGYEIRLSEASSGFQSTVPLYLVTKYLTEQLNAQENGAIKELSIEEQRKLDKEIQAIMNDPELTHEVRLTYLRALSAKRRVGCLINIVEEPEQNLFPTSQKKLLDCLLEFKNTNHNNQLIITTHSPYLLSYLTIAVKTYQLNNLIQNEQAKERLTLICPLAAALNPDDLVVYECDEVKGSVKKLDSYKGLPSDENQLNHQLSEGNELFAQLLEIQQEYAPR